MIPKIEWRNIQEACHWWGSAHIGEHPVGGMTLGHGSFEVWALGEDDIIWSEQYGTAWDDGEWPKVKPYLCRAEIAIFKKLVENEFKISIRKKGRFASHYLTAEE